MNIASLIPWLLILTSVNDQMTTALSKIGLTKETARIDLDDMNFFGGDKYRLHFFDVFISDPYKIPDYTKTICRSCLDNCSNIANLTIFASSRLRAAIRRNLIADPVAEYEKQLIEPDYLHAALLDLYKTMHARPDTVLLKARTDLVPSVLAKEIALLVVASRKALEWRRLAFGKTGEKELERIYEQVIQYIVSLDTSSFDDTAAREVEDFIGRVDYEYLFTGATDLALVLDSVKVRLKRMEDLKINKISIPTPIGDIIINGRQDDLYEKDLIPFIIIDLGGDDHYLCGAANQGVQNPVSIVIDIAGNDYYISEEKDCPSFGGAILGYSFLLDLEGNDYYLSKNICQGTGVYGVGVLYDAGGNDSLVSFTAAQGAGLFGIGILANEGGSDYYECYQQAQGYGYVKGCGLLLDNTGNDIYIANDSDIVFPASQTKEHNSSLAQGMGFGKRADYVDGHSLAGGVGILIDGAGNDQYKCGVFGQGCAYWYGVGILNDEAGDDNYQSVWYAQGSGAHFGVGILRDVSGDDIYRATMNMALGAGHDFTIGFLLEESGNDHYYAPSLSLGAGNANGIGIFWDKSGDDIYESTSEVSLGCANPNPNNKGSLREYMLCLGIFIDGNGDDRYSLPFAKNRRFWTENRFEKKGILPNEKGIGIDF